MTIGFWYKDGDKLFEYLDSFNRGQLWTYWSDKDGNYKMFITDDDKISINCFKCEYITLDESKTFDMIVIQQELVDQYFDNDILNWVEATQELEKCLTTPFPIILF